MNIHKITSDFSFAALDLEEPKSLQGGSAYSVPIRYNGEVLLLQTEKCMCKNGLVTNGRKTYIDLVFTNTDTYILNWIESLEEHLQKIIFEKSADWFENSLTEDDVESSFLSILKPQKNRTKYILRCYVHNLTNFNVGVKIYDEAGNDLGSKDITSGANIACIISLQDIKFSSKNFQVFINVKQIMLFRDLEKDRKILLEKPTEDALPPAAHEPVAPALLVAPDALVAPALAVPDANARESTDHIPAIELGDINQIIDNSSTELSDQSYLEESGDNVELNLDDIEELDIDTLGMEEFDALEEDELDENNNTSKYIELYNKAREKAELAKKEALIAFLEANNIKKKYNL